MSHSGNTLTTTARRARTVRIVADAIDDDSQQMVVELKRVLKLTQFTLQNHHNTKTVNSSGAVSGTAVTSALTFVSSWYRLPSTNTFFFPDTTE